MTVVTRSKRASLAMASRDYNQQLQSPLFGKLPGEIRNQIFEYALAEHEDETRPYPVGTYYTRPGFRAPWVRSLALFRTCRRAFDESRHLVPKEVTLWQFFESHDRRPPWQKDLSLEIASIPEACEFHLHALCQLYWLEGGGLSSLVAELERHPPRPRLGFRALTITIRHTDWWFWESEQYLHTDSSWTQDLVVPETVTEINMAFEIPQRKRAELDRLLRHQALHWTFARRDDAVFVPLGREHSVTTWTGSASFDGRNFEPRVPITPDRLSRLVQPTTIDYQILTLTWKPVPRNERR